MKHKLPAILAIAAIATISLQAQVTYDRILSGVDKEPHNWLSYSGTPKNQRFSPLTQITTANVKNLQQAWIWQARSLEKFQATPLVVDGVMYTVEAPNNVVALDAVTGRPYWQFNYTPAQEARACCGRVNRGVAITSTLAIYETFSANADVDPRTLDVLTPALQERYRSELAKRDDPNDDGPAAWRSLLRKEMDFERAFVAAGGRLVAGSDPTGWGGIVAGFGNQRQVELLSKVRRGVADVATSRKRVELQVAQLEQQENKLTEQAKKALSMGREDLAREALTRKSGLAGQVGDLRAQQAQLQAEEEKLTMASQRLQAKVEAFRTKKETIKATYTAAEAQTRINEAFSGISEEMGDVGLAIQRAEDKTAQMQARAGAIDELIASGALDDATAIGQGDDIARELEMMSSQSDVEAELAALKAGTTPRPASIEAGDPTPAAEPVADVAEREKEQGQS